MRFFILAFVSLSAGLFLSCAVGTDPGECQSLDCLPAHYNLHLTLSSTSDADFSFREVRGVAAFLRPGNRTTFESESDRIVPEVVSVNGYALAPPESGNHLFVDIFSDTVLASPGGYNVWSVIDAGLADLPSLMDSIQTPLDPVRVVYPTVTDTLSVSEGFQIRLEGFVDPSMPVNLSVYQTNWSSDGGPTQYDTLLSSNASISLTPEILHQHGIGPGDILIWIRQRYEKRSWITPELRSLLTFTVEHDMTITLID